MPNLAKELFRFCSMSNKNASLNFSYALNNHNVAFSEKSLHQIQMQLMNK